MIQERKNLQVVKVANAQQKVHETPQPLIGQKQVKDNDKSGEEKIVCSKHLIILPSGPKQKMI